MWSTNIGLLFMNRTQKPQNAQRLSISQNMFAVNNLNVTLMKEVHNRCEELKKIYEEEKFLRQKSRFQWLKLGDRNTEFFSIHTKERENQKNWAHGTTLSSTIIKKVQTLAYNFIWDGRPSPRNRWPFLRKKGYWGQM